jgi:hypothetical protein
MMKLRLPAAVLYSTGSYGAKARERLIYLKRRNSDSHDAHTRQ